MKYIINKKNKVVLKSEFKIQPKEGELIYDPEFDYMILAKMKAVAKANKFKLSGKKASDIKESFDEQIASIKVEEKTKINEYEVVLNIVEEGFSNEKSEDEILIEAVQAGVKFRKAASLVQKIMIELGYSISTKERYSKASEIMDAEEFNPQTHADVIEMACIISDSIPATDEDLAISQIRKWIKINEFVMPKKSKPASANQFVKAMTWITLNADEELDVFEEWLEEKEYSEKNTALWLLKFTAIQDEISKGGAD